MLPGVKQEATQLKLSPKGINFETHQILYIIISPVILEVRIYYQNYQSWRQVLPGVKEEATQLELSPKGINFETHQILYIFISPVILLFLNLVFAILCFMASSHHLSVRLDT